MEGMPGNPLEGSEAELMGGVVGRVELGHGSKRATPCLALVAMAATLGGGERPERREGDGLKPLGKGGGDWAGSGAVGATIGGHALMEEKSGCGEQVVR